MTKVSFRRAAATAALLGGALLVVACASSEDLGGGASAGAAGSAPPVADPTPAGGREIASTASQDVAPTASGWIAGNLVTLTAAQYDSESGTVVITADVRNDANTEGFTSAYGGWIALDTGRGAPQHPIRISSVSVPESITEIELGFTAPPDGLVLEDAVLQLGGPGELQWLVPLAPGKQGTGTEPAEYDVAGVADASGMSFTATSAQLVPWSCSDSDDYGPNGSGRVTFAPGADDKMGLIVWGDIVESVSYTGGNAVTTMTLVQPDGVSVNAIGAVWTVFDAGDRVEDYGMCFTVDSPGTGDFALSFTTYRGSAATLAFTLD